MRAGRDRIERRRRLVHQQHVGLDREAARDAEALLLAARERECVAPQPVLDLVPQRRLAQGALDALVEIVLEAEHARPEGDVVADRLRKRVGLLEHHPDAPAHLDRIDPGRVEVGAVVEHRALDRGARDEVVHAVERAQDRALAAAGGADEGRDLALAHLERDVPHGRDAVVADRQPAHVEDHALAGPRTSGRLGAHIERAQRNIGHAAHHRR